MRPRNAPRKRHPLTIRKRPSHRWHHVHLIPLRRVKQQHRSIPERNTPHESRTYLLIHQSLPLRLNRPSQSLILLPYLILPSSYLVHSLRGGRKGLSRRPFLPPHPPPISKLYNYILIIAHERLRIKSHRCLNRRAEFHRLLVPAENRDELKPELERNSHSLSRNDIAVADDRLTGYLRAGK